MQIDKERLELLRAVLVDEEKDAVSFYPKGSESDKGYWYVTENGKVSEAGPSNEKGDQEFYENRSDASFVEFAQKNELIAEVALYDADGRYAFKEQKFEDWEHLARYLGISNLIPLSTKIPQTVAKKFEYYASKEGTKSEVLRNLIYNYVVKSIKTNAERDMFRD